MQVSVMFKTLGGAIVSSLWQWFYEGGMHCGFRSFPIFGLTAARFGYVNQKKKTESNKNITKC